MKNKYIISFIVIILCFSALTACNSSRYNENPDVSKKNVGSDNGIIERFHPKKFDDILAQASTAIIGEVLEDDILYTFNPYGSEENSEVQKSDAKIKSTIANIKVIKTIAGKEPVEEIIKYYQLGQPKSDNLQTKVQKGKKYVFILKYYDTKDYYGATSFEDSIFVIEDEILTSLSKKSFCARYDGVKTDIIIEDIKNSKALKP